MHFIKKICLKIHTLPNFKTLSRFGIVEGLFESFFNQVL